MAAPDNYAVGSGLPIYGGRADSTGGGSSGRPAWRTAMAANTWAQVPGNTLASINPENNPAINPNYPSSAPWHGSVGQAAIIGAWGTACWDEAGQTLWLPNGGGHQDYAGNEPYKINIGAATPTWSMPRYPSGAVGNTVTLNDGLESSGVYADGRPRSNHGYNHHIYIPGVGPLLTRLVGGYISGQSGSPDMFALNPANGEAAIVGSLSGVGSAAGFPYGGAAYDSVRNVAWMVNTGTSKVMKYDVATRAVTSVGTYDNLFGSYAHPVYDSTHDVLIVLSDAGAGYLGPFNVVDLTTFAITSPSRIGAMAAGISLTGVMGAAWDTTNGRLLLWHNSTNTAEITALSPTGDPRTAPWGASVLTVAPGNTVTPSVRVSNGTNGRFIYSPSLGGCILLNGVSEPIYFFATE